MLVCLDHVASGIINADRVTHWGHVYEVRPRKDHRGVDLISAIPALFTAHGAFGLGVERPEANHHMTQMRQARLSFWNAVEIWQMKEKGKYEK